jgi:hypothetical protein
VGSTALGKDIRHIPGYPSLKVCSVCHLPELGAAMEECNGVRFLQMMNKHAKVSSCKADAINLTTMISKTLLRK